jgi:hypothetical protein
VQRLDESERSSRLFSRSELTTAFAFFDSTPISAAIVAAAALVAIVAITGLLIFRDCTVEGLKLERTFLQPSGNLR